MGLLITKTTSLRVKPLKKIKTNLYKKSKQRKKIVHEHKITNNCYRYNNSVKVKYTDYNGNIMNIKPKYSYIYNGVPGGWYI